MAKREGLLGGIMAIAEDEGGLVDNPGDIGWQMRYRRLLHPVVASSWERDIVNIKYI